MERRLLALVLQSLIVAFEVPEVVVGSEAAEVVAIAATVEVIVVWGTVVMTAMKEVNSGLAFVAWRVVALWRTFDRTTYESVYQGLKEVVGGRNYLQKGVFSNPFR